MAREFWNSWQLWEKMCFVLAAAICVVLLIGCGKVLYSRWRLRKYTALVVAKAAHRQEMQRVGSSRRHKTSEIPFGIRAIESGIEVDGVWISRSNTPVPSAPATPAPASPLPSPSITPRPNPQLDGSPDRSSCASNISRLDIPQPVYGYPGVNPRHSGASSTTLNPTSEKLKPGANSQISSGSDVPDLARVQQSRPTYQPRHSSQLRYSNSHDYDNHDAATVTALESDTLSSNRKNSDESEYRTQQHMPASSSSSTNSNDGPHAFKRDETESVSEFSFRLASSDRVNQQAMTLPNMSNSQPTGYQDLDLEHIPPAVPRIKLTSVNTESSASRHPAEQNWYFTNPPTPLHENEDPFATPRKNPAEIEQTGRFSSDMRYSQHQSFTMDQSLRTNQDNQPPHAFQYNRPISESHVIRKINSGFEILRPGTLNRPPISEEKKAENNAEKPLRKLQRRSRDVGRARESKFIEGT